MFITPSFKKSLIVDQFQGNYLNREFSSRTLLSSVLFRSVSIISQIALHRHKVHISTCRDRERGRGEVGNENVTGFKAILRISVAKLVISFLTE